MAAQVTVDGVAYEGKQRVTIADGKVIIDGEDVTPDSKEITISVVGYLRNLNVDVCQRVDVHGTVGTLYLGEGGVVADDVIVRK